MCGPRLVVENFSMFLVRTYCMGYMLTHAKFPQKLEFILSTEQICNSRKMSAMLRFRLKDKLPKPVHPEEYKKYITVLEASKDNWSLQCNFCNLRFKGRAHRANCHIIGKVGEGVVVCNKIPSHVKFQFVQRVFPELADEEVALKTDEPNPKRTKQSSVYDFVSKAAFEHTDAEIAKFVLTCCFFQCHSKSTLTECFF